LRKAVVSGRLPVASFVMKDDVPANWHQTKTLKDESLPNWQLAAGIWHLHFKEES
jgi:hypothetical protein